MSTETVKKVVQNYIDATYTGNADLLASCFHKDATMTGYMGPNLVIATPGVFVDEIRNNPSMQSQGHPFKGQIEDIYVNGGVAVVRLHETGMWGEGEVMELFQLLLDNDGAWKIIAKCFTTLPPAV